MNEDRCVVCGGYVPEGQQVCIMCKEKHMKAAESVLDFKNRHKLQPIRPAREAERHDKPANH